MSVVTERAPPLRASAAPRRRVFLLVCLYRIACGVLLLSVTYATDLRPFPAQIAGLLLPASIAYLGFGFLCVAAADRAQRAPMLWLLIVQIGDLAFLVPLLTALHGNETLGILLLPQLAANGWLIRTRAALVFPALASIALLSVAFYVSWATPSEASMLLQVSWQSLAYFVVTGLGMLLGNYNSASEALAQQRGIDLANLEQVNQLIIRDMDDGVLVIDESGILRNRNPQADHLLERDSFPVGNTRLADYSPPLEELWRAWHSENGPANATLQLSDPPRNLSVRLASISAVRRSDCLLYLQDLGRAQTHAQQIKLAALGRLTASIAHEVRNPLSAINHASELLKESFESRGGADADQRLLEIIHGNAQRISRLLQEVMQLNRRDHRQAQPVPLHACITALLNDIVTAERIPAELIGTQIPPHLVAWFDQGHLGQIVWNLVRNSVHYCQHRPGSIQIVVRRGHQSGTLILEVSDDGRGIPAEIRAQVFEPFFTTRTGGTGLGLYLARELTEANDGRLELLESGSGARFRLTMPSSGQ